MVLEITAWLARERLFTLRHLPQGTVLPAPRTLEAQRLLHALLALPDQVDPVDWLARERGHEVVSLALFYELTHLHDALRTRQAGRARQARSGPYRNLLDVPPDLPLFADLQGETLPADDVLDALVGQIRMYQGPIPARKGLLAEVLAIADESGPIAWLREKRTYSAALLTTDALLDESRPSPSLDLGRVLGRRRIHDAVTTPRGGRILFDSLTLRGDGFTLSLRAHLEALPLTAVDDVEDFWTWLGFGRVIDDRGQTYLVRHRVVRSGRRLIGSPGDQITMAFFPALDAQARRLLVHGTRVALLDEGRWVQVAQPAADIEPGSGRVAIEVPIS